MLHVRMRGEHPAANVYQMLFHCLGSVFILLFFLNPNILGLMNKQLLRGEMDPTQVYRRKTGANCIDVEYYDNLRNTGFLPHEQHKTIIR